MADSKFAKAKNVLKALELPVSQLEQIIKVFDIEINKGLHPDEKIRRGTVLPMVKTFISGKFHGKESGIFLGMDLGGTNFRIILAELSGNANHLDTQTETALLPKELLSQPCRHLYDYMAAKLSSFLKQRNLEKKHIKLGYVFSYPSVQESVKCAKLITWTQTFNCPDGVGEDAGQMLQDAINRRQDCDVEVACVLNDTTATLLAGAFTDSDCAVGVIIGTGANAAYCESMDKMKWFADKHYPTNPPDQMIIDIEWGCLGDDGSLSFIRTKYDEQVDKTSLHPASYTFEKMLSGHFFGELCRVVLEDLAEQGLFLTAPGGGKDRLPKPWQLKSADISPVNNDPDDGNLVAAQGVLERLGLLPFCDDDDKKILHLVCSTLTKRDGDIVAAALATILRHTGRSNVSIAFDGSFYRCQPRLSERINETLCALCPGTQIKLFRVNDGSGRGGALGAALA